MTDFMLPPGRGSIDEGVVDPGFRTVTLCQIAGRCANFKAL